jgi:hypothetical protein
MKKTKTAKLTIARETLKRLDPSNLQGARGGQMANTSPYYTYCDCQTWEGCPKK